MDLFLEERKLLAQGISLVAGVDEVGRGCLAGPVYAAAVILNPDRPISNLRDSKQLSALQREKLNDEILAHAVATHIAWVDPGEIDRINIFQASLKAMKLALQSLSQEPGMVLVDGKFPVPLRFPQKTLVKGDSRSASIAAASIIAKVARDRLMVQQEQRFPAFSFSQHKGYGTQAHLRELKAHGPTPLHRYSFAPVRECAGQFSKH